MSWPIAPLGVAASIDRTSVLPGSMTGRYVGLEHIDESGEIDINHCINTDDLASSKFQFTPHHVLFGKLRPYLRKVARPAFPGICSTDILPILPGPQLDRGYLYHYLRSPGVIQQATARSSGANLPRISPGILAQFLIPLPPLEEQKRIAAILDKADAIRRKREQAIQLADDFLRSLFLDMFGDPIRNPKGWPVRLLSDLYSRQRQGTRCGPFGSSLNKSEYQNEGIPVWGIDNVLPNEFDPSSGKFISEEKFKDLESFSVRKGDILISRAGTVGRMCVVDKHIAPSIIGTNLIRLALDQQSICPEYFCTMFTIFSKQLAQVKANSKADSYSFMSTSTLATLFLPLPPIDAQKLYLEIALRTKKTIHHHRRSASLSEACLGPHHKSLFREADPSV